MKGEFKGVSFTIEDYNMYCNLFPIRLSDKNEEYKLEAKENKKNDNNIKH